jgi:hypothetical protein
VTLAVQAGDLDLARRALAEAEARRRDAKPSNVVELVTKKRAR